MTLEVFFGQYKAVLTQQSQEAGLFPARVTQRRLRSIDSFTQYFHTVPDRVRQSVLEYCFARPDFEGCIERIEAKPIASAAAEVEETAYRFKDDDLYLQAKSALPQDGEFDVQFLDIILGEIITKKVSAHEGKFYIDVFGDNTVQVELVWDNKEQNSFKCIQSGHERFIRELYRQFLRSDYTLEAAIEDRNIDYILDHHAEKLEDLSLAVLVGLNYCDADGRYGTFLHKAINHKDISYESIRSMVRKIHYDYRCWFYEQYFMLPNERGETIAHLALRVHDMDLPGGDQPGGGVAIDWHDTYTRSVHETVGKSIHRLALSMDHNFGIGAIANNDGPASVNMDDPTTITFIGEKEHSFRDALIMQFGLLVSEVDMLAAKTYAELFEWMRPSVLDYEAAEGAKTAAVVTLKEQLLPKVKALLDDIVNNDHLGNEGLFVVRASEMISNLRLSIKELIALAYYSCRDPIGLAYIKPVDGEIREGKLRLDAELSFLRGLYDVRRGYNNDEGDYDPTTSDRNRCSGGAVNSIINGLNGVHKLVEIVKVTAETIMYEIGGLIYSSLSTLAADPDCDQNTLRLNLWLWQQNKALPLWLKEQINNRFKADIIKSVNKQPGNYLSMHPVQWEHKVEQLYYAVVERIKISNRLQRFIADIDLTRMFDSILTVDQLPYFILSEKGYVSVLNYVFENDQLRFTQILNMATGKQLMNLAHNNFNSLDFCDQGIKGLFIEAFVKHEGVINSIDNTGFTVLTWAINHGHIEVILALQNAVGIDPNLLVRGAPALHWGVEVGDPAVIRALQGFADLDPNLRGRDGTSVIHRAEEVINDPNKRLAVIQELHGFKRELRGFERLDLNLINKLELLYKRILYRKDLEEFGSMLVRYGIQIPDGSAAIDLLLNHRYYNRLVISKIHPDHNLDNAIQATTDTQFVNTLRDRLHGNLDTKWIQHANVVLHKVNIGFKCLDLMIDAARLGYEPTESHLKIVVMDFMYLYSLCAGINVYTVTLGIAGVSYEKDQGNYKVAIGIAISLVFFFSLPYISPQLSFACSVSLASYAGYNAMRNAYSFVLERTDELSTKKSSMAYRNVAKALSKTGLQEVYDFDIAAKEYELQIQKLSTEIKEKSQAASEAYEFCYSSDQALDGIIIGEILAWSSMNGA